jgi:MHS family citrate/tricarballylate:H+ symporter-like MFS transporter
MSEPRATRAQIASVAAGNALEFYDFLVFSIFAVQIGQAFFPASDPINSLLAALATFGAGFVTRPLGAWVFGRYADRHGRRPAMVASFTVLGLSSLALALVPSYAAIGAAAPVLAIIARLVQGLALGGEVGPSSAFLTEIAPPDRRGAYVSLQFASQNFAILAAGLVGVGLSAAMNEAALATWGWRVALIAGAAIVPIGLVLRRSLPETLEAAPTTRERAAPSRYRHIAILALLTVASATVVNYVLTYLSTFAQAVLAMTPREAFGAAVAVGVAGTLGALLSGVLSDRFGRRPLMLWPIALSAVLVMPAFWWLEASPNPLLLYAVALVLRFTTVLAGTAAFVAVSEAFPAGVRSTALGLTYALAVSTLGGTTQFMIAWLTKVTGSPMAIAWYMLFACVVGLAAMAFLRETAPRFSARA